MFMISYVKDLYPHKSNKENLPLKSISKLLLNSLLGRFGLQLEKSTTEIVDSPKFTMLS